MKMKYQPKRMNAGMRSVGKSGIVDMIINIYIQNADMEYIHYIRHCLKDNMDHQRMMADPIFMIVQNS